MPSLASTDLDGIEQVVGDDDLAVVKGQGRRPAADRHPLHLVLPDLQADVDEVAGLAGTPGNVFHRQEHQLMRAAGADDQGGAIGGEGDAVGVGHGLAANVEGDLPVLGMHLGFEGQLAHPVVDDPAFLDVVLGDRQITAMAVREDDTLAVGREGQPAEVEGIEDPAFPEGLARLGVPAAGLVGRVLVATSHFPSGDSASPCGSRRADQR